MEKSKAYKYHAQEIRRANLDAVAQLDDDWENVAGLLNFDATKRTRAENVAKAAEGTGERTVPGVEQARIYSKENQRELFDDVLKDLRGEGVRKIEPAGMPGKKNGEEAGPSEKELAIKRREHLERLQAKADESRKSKKSSKKEKADFEDQEESDNEDQIDTGSAQPISK